MDFSSLDLLASTALRDNNPTQGDDSSSPTEPSHPHHNHHEAEENNNEDDDDEDDDKADDNKDCVQKQEVIADGDSELGKMGSVKCGKNKKSPAKPASILVKDGKYVATKQTSSDSDNKDNKQTGNEAPRDPGLPVSQQKRKGEGQEGGSGMQIIAIKSILEKKGPAQVAEEVKPATTSAQPGRNGIGRFTRRSTNASSPRAGLPSTVKKMLESFVPGSRNKISNDSKPESCAKSSQHPNQVMNKSCALEAEKDFNGDQSLGGESPMDSTQTEVCDEASNEQQEKEKEGSNNGNKQTDDSCSSDCESSLHRHVDRQTDLTHTDTNKQTDSHLDKEENADISSNSLNVAVCGSSAGGEKSYDLLVPKDKEMSLETRTSNVCDENMAVVPSCSQTEVKADVHHCPKILTVDQIPGSLETKEPQLTDSSKQCEPKGILSPPPPPPRVLVVSPHLVLSDHTYSVLSKGKHFELADDSGDAFESADENVSADETERRPRSLSVDSPYLHCSLTGLPPQQEKRALLSPTLSVDSVSNDSSLSEHSAAAPSGGQSYSILMGSPTLKGPGVRSSLAFLDSQSMAGDKPAAGSDGTCRMAATLLDAGGISSLLDSNNLVSVGPKCGKFRIGTFGSFSNSHLDLEKESKKKLRNGLSSDSVMKTSLSSPAIASPSSPFPLLQSPGIEWDRSDAGSEAPDDLDSSTTEDKFLSSSHDSEVLGSTVSQVWRHPVFHDHDYCSKEVSEEYLGKPAPPAPVKTGKRKYVRKKDKQDSEEEKLRKGKYLKRELLKKDNLFNLGAGRGTSNRGTAQRASSLVMEPLTTKPNPVGRPRKRTEKQLEEYDVETGTKMKITGKYQDQYVYYLNKSSHNRRRKIDEKMPHGDRIILPAPKPGDIVVPHLSDADCEAIRHGGRMALLSNAPQPQPSTSSLPHPDFSADMDSSIVNTILSMETEHGNLNSPLPTYDNVSGGEDFAADIEGNLTSEQVKMLFDCLDTMEETATSQDLDLFTSAEAIPGTSTVVDSLAATSMAEDLMAPIVVPSSTTSSITSPSEALLEKAEPVSPKLEPDALTCNVSSEVQHTDSKSLVAGLPVSQPSVEKNLEFLKTPFYPESSVAPSGSHDLFGSSSSTSLIGPMSEMKSDEVNETPWIVTVTLYWNDIPAIVINNLPHVRLVDIHKQILPAKDTGILKKRCQLMGIQVSNCSEMQRYFLVQYGRAHNSKSTLVISKDEAQRLITYYAHPPPRNLRGEEGGFRRSSSFGELHSIVDRPGGRPAAMAFNQPRKRGGFRRRPLPTSTRSYKKRQPKDVKKKKSNQLDQCSVHPSPEPIASPVEAPVAEPLLTTPLPAVPAFPAKGLRHKKINFREMLKGEDTSSQLSPLHDSGMEEESSFGDDTPGKGRGSKAAASTGGKKRRAPKDTASGASAKRGRKKGNKTSQEAPSKAAESDIVVDNKETSSVAASGKSKKRSPGSTTSGTLSVSSRSPKSKYGPIKVNVKSLVHAGGSSSLSADGTQPKKKNLFGRKSSSSSSSTDVVIVDGSGDTTARSNPLRVLRISHQDVGPSSPPTPQILSPTAEVHLDLYKRACSACVKCRTCHKFLSVAEFLEHQHVSVEGKEGGEGVKGSSEQDFNQQRRILVPMNKENISLEEQHLWNEFVSLQESLGLSLGVSSMGAYPLTPLSPASPNTTPLYNSTAPALNAPQLATMTPESPLPEGLPNGHDESVVVADSALQKGKCVVPASSGEVSSLPDSSAGTPAKAAKFPWDSQSRCSSPPTFPIRITHTQNEEKFVDDSAASSKVQSDAAKVAIYNKKVWSFQQKRGSLTSHVRTSSRKRETKRLYSFEKYEFGVGGKKGGRGEADSQDFEDDLSVGVLDDDASSVTVGDGMLHLAPVATAQESQNA